MTGSWPGAGWELAVGWLAGKCIWEKTSGSREGASGRRHLEGNIWKTSRKEHLGRCIWEKPFGGASGRTLGKALWGSSEVALDTPGWETN